MTAKSNGSGFGTDIETLIQSATADYLYREVRANSNRVDITNIQTDLDSGLFIRSAGDATANGGAINVARVAVFRGISSSGAAPKIPPNTSVATGSTPSSFLIQDLKGWEFLWQDVVSSWPRTPPLKFLPGELTAVGDRSLFVVLAGFRQVLAGTIAVPGVIAAMPDAFVSMSVGGIDYGQARVSGVDASGMRSMPRYDVEKP